MNETGVFMKLTDACRVTGLSTKYLRSGCRDNSVPHIMVGNRYMVNVAALLRKLDRESMGDSEEE